MSLNVVCDRSARPPQTNVTRDLEAFGARDANHPNHPRGRDVRAPAGGEIDLIDLDQSHLAGSGRRLAKRQPFGLRVGHEPDADVAVLPDDAIRRGLGFGDGVGWKIPIQIDRGRVRAQVEAGGHRPEPRGTDRRQDVLAGVLLHVIESAKPVDLPDDAVTGRERRRRHVNDRPLRAVGDLNDVGIAQAPHVKRLPARRRIERGLVQHDAIAVPVALATHHRTLEGAGHGVGVVEALGGNGHGCLEL
jgi:hypothetical protein